MGSTGKANRGGVGEFIPPRRKDGFGLKVVRLLDEDGRRNENFWNEARSIHRYCASVRFLGGAMKIPLAAHYYLNRHDPLADIEWREVKRAWDEYRLRSAIIDNDEPDSPWDPKTSSIDDLFHSAFVDREEAWRFHNYKPAAGPLLRHIYEAGLDADLLMIYPVAYGGEKNLSCYYDEPFSAADARSLIGQLAATILDLYRSGTAHGDIKPKNIMVSETEGKKLFRLTDFGSTHSEDIPSDSGTESFFNRELYDKILEQTGSELTARVYTDFYALNRTVVAMAIGRDPGCLVYEDCVVERWPEITEQWQKLRETDDRTMDDFRQLAAEEPLSIDPNWEPFESYIDEFDPMDKVNGKLTYGRLHEQIAFSEQFDPMMRFRHIRIDLDVWKLFPEFCHTPLTINRGGVIFHAPDDARTEKPPQDFHFYIPADLDHIRLTEEETERLIGHGRKLDAYFRTRPREKACFPSKEDIFRCGGELKMLWGRRAMGDHLINYADYFRYLATGEADFSIDDWLTLLPRLPELEKKLTRAVCLKLLDRVRKDSRGSWLFGNETFVKHVLREKFDFSAKEWLKLCGYTSGFDDRIDLDLAWKIFKAARGTEAKLLLKNHPRIAELLHSIPSPETDQERYFEDFINLCKWDREAFLRYFPDGRRTDLSVKQWQFCLHANPELAEFVPEEILPQLSRKTWVRILGTFPERIEGCPCADKFNAAEWGSLLLQQPKLKNYCPPGIVFPDRLKKRLDRAQFPSGRSEEQDV